MARVARSNRGGVRNTNAKGIRAAGGNGRGKVVTSKARGARGKGGTGGAGG